MRYYVLLIQCGQAGTTLLIANSLNTALKCNPPWVASGAGHVGIAQINEVGPEDAAGDLANLGEEHRGAEPEHEHEEGPQGHNRPPEMNHHVVQTLSVFTSNVLFCGIVPC